MNRVFYQKLIRDKIPERMDENGAQYEIQTLTETAFEKALLQKLKEEAEEVIKSESKEESVKELADLLDVIEAIKEQKNISQTEIIEAQEKAFAQKGGFKKRLFLLWTEETK